MQIRLAALALAATFILQAYPQDATAAGATATPSVPSTPKFIKGAAVKRVILTPQTAKTGRYRKATRRRVVRRRYVRRTSGVKRRASSGVARVPALDLSSVSAVRNRAKLLIQGGLLTQADRLLKQAIEVNPQEQLLIKDLASVSLYRAEKMLAAGYLECALIRAREALFLDPSLTEAADLINEILRRQGHNPEDPQVRLGMANSLAADHRYIAAIVEYRESLKLKPSTGAYLGLGDMYMKAAQTSLAQQAYRQAQLLDPNNAMVQRKMRTVPISATLNSEIETPESNRRQAAKILTELWRGQKLKNGTELWHRTSNKAPHTSKEGQASGLRNAGRLPALPGSNPAPETGNRGGAPPQMPKPDYMGPEKPVPANGPRALSIPGAGASPSPHLLIADETLPVHYGPPESKSVITSALSSGGIKPGLPEQCNCD